ncbi:MAG: prepilin-type N-terminal cleavage/methylation domain-containing protein [Thermoanaerobaculia bacterium]
MIRSQAIPRSKQSGYSMAEILVALAIFAIVITAALLAYDRSNRVFKQSVESADVQQGTRVAFNRLVADIRMAGFDFDRDGIPTGVDVIDREDSTAYSVGTVITVGGTQYRCTTAGTTASSEPSFNTSPGSTTTDGTAIWTALASTNEYQQPDEQIEFAGRTVITMRGNLDYETASAAENGRETDYEPAGGQFPVVTTANDEIVTYALVSRDSTKNDNSITFYADVARPRNSFPGGSIESAVTIDGIDTSLDSNGIPANPPYTLYRINLKDDGTLNRVPVADNIRSVRYTFFEDQAGKTTLKDLSDGEIPASGVDQNTGTIGGDGPWDPNAPGVVQQREIRKKIKAIGLELVGMSPQPDNDYTEPNELNTAVQHYRQYTLATTIVPRNLGKRGMREQAIKPPGPATITKVCRGGCGVVYLQWNAPIVNAEFGGVDQYQVEWGTSAAGPWIGNRSVGTALSYSLAGLDPTQTWYVRVKSVNTYGSDESLSLSIQPINMTKPLPPANVTASSDQQGHIDVMWDEVISNVTGVTQTCCVPDAPPATTQNCGAAGLSGDLIRNPTEVMYRVIRNTTDSTTGATELWTGTAATGPYTGTGPTYDASTARFSFLDTSVPNCTNYYYFIEAIDRLCSTNAATNSPADTNQAKSGVSSSAMGIATSGGLVPSDPTNLQILDTSTCAGVNCTINLQWPRVSTDSSGGSINVKEYALHIVAKKESDHSVVSDNSADPLIVTVASTAANPVLYSDTQPRKVASEDVYYEYQVAAQQCSDPGPALRSDFIPTPPRKFPCNFSATNVITVSPNSTPYEGDGLSAGSAWTVTDPTAVSITTTESVAAIGATFTIVSTGISTSSTETGPTMAESFAFPTSGNGQLWRVDLEFTDSEGCKKFLSRYIYDSPTSCCLLPSSFDTSLISGTSRTVTVTLSNVCDTALTIQNSGLGITWDPSAGAGLKLESITWPTSTGTTVQAQNTSTGTLTITPPVAANKVVPANSASYQITLTFTKNITNAVLDELCVTYLQSGEIANGSCRVVTQTTTPNYSVCP